MESIFIILGITIGCISTVGYIIYRIVRMIKYSVKSINKKTKVRYKIIKKV